MQFKQLFLGSVLTLVTISAGAHVGGHDESQPITQDQAAARAEKIVPVLIKDKKLDASWSKRERKDVKLQDTGSGRVWVVSYRKLAEKDPKKQNLFIFIDDLGNYLNMNHTGKH